MVQKQQVDLAALCQAHSAIGKHYSQLVCDIQQHQVVDAVAVSGQTVYHVPAVDPARNWHTPSTLQLGEVSRVSETCGVRVVYDFRQTDMAAAGQGAPLVSFADALLYGHPSERRAIHNLGGISNLTYLPAAHEITGVFAFDTGPANCLIDDAMQRYFGRDFDEGGRVAGEGQVDETVLARWLEHPYFQQSIPKTTGREAFYLDAMLALAGNDLSPSDLVATLTALTVRSIVLAYQQQVLPQGIERVLVAGGGSDNTTLLQGLQTHLPVPVTAFRELGWQAKDREALAFAVLGYYALLGKINTLPKATGAAYPVIAGKFSFPSRTP
jgi:anhydro-N-acetylmuramic acid kinase